MCVRARVSMEEGGCEGHHGDAIGPNQTWDVLVGMLKTCEVREPADEDQWGTLTQPRVQRTHTTHRVGGHATQTHTQCGWTRNKHTHTVYTTNTQTQHHAMDTSMERSNTH